MKIENKIAIGCIVQWYEVEIVGFYIESLLQAIEGVDNKENVIVDVCFYMSENFEPIDEKQMKLDIRDETTRHFFFKFTYRQHTIQINDVVFHI